MKPTIQSELAKWIPFDDTYKKEEVVAGYENTQPENIHRQLILEEELEWMLDNNSFIFSNDQKCFHIWCTHCQHVPCAWDIKERSMINFHKVQHEEDTKPNRYQHALCLQMTLIINDGPTGCGNRVKLPTCVLSGVRGLFSDPESIYTGHHETAE
jgi:hypothetical protein